MAISSKQKQHGSSVKRKEPFRMCGFGIFEAIARMDEALLKKMHEDAKIAAEGGEEYVEILRKGHEGPEALPVD